MTENENASFMVGTRACLFTGTLVVCSVWINSCVQNMLMGYR